jgi:hypothetical protein
LCHILLSKRSSFFGKGRVKCWKLYLRPSLCPMSFTLYFKDNCIEGRMVYFVQWSPINQSLSYSNAFQVRSGSDKTNDKRKRLSTKLRSLPSKHLDDRLCKPQYFYPGFTAHRFHHLGFTNKIFHHLWMCMSSMASP